MDIGHELLPTINNCQLELTDFWRQPVMSPPEHVRALRSVASPWRIGADVPSALASPSGHPEGTRVLKIGGQETFASFLSSLGTSVVAWTWTTSASLVR